MSKIFVDVGLSLDGCIAGPNGGPGNPFGDDGVRIHAWLFQQARFLENLGLPGTPGETGPDNDIVNATLDRTGAYIMGRRMFDEGETGWPENAPFHAPVFVLTHTRREPWVRPGGTTFHFVTDGLQSALSQAREAAGEKDVRICGGADAIRQSIRAGVVDELQIHLAPVLLGGGIRLFDTLTDADLRLELTGTVPSGKVTHLSYRIIHPQPST